MARLARDPEVEALIAAYRADLRGGRSFRRERGDLAGARVPAADRRPGGMVAALARAAVRRLGGARECAGDVDDHCRPRAGQTRVPGLCYQRLGRVAAWVHAEFHGRFMQVAADVGFTPKVAELQWWAVAKVAAVAGVAPQRAEPREVRYGEPGADRWRRSALGSASGRIASEHQALRRGGDALSRRRDRWAAAQARPGPVRPSRRGSGRASRPGWRRRCRATWSRCASRCVRTRCRTSNARCASSRCGSRDQAPEVTAVRDLRRAHIERYKRHVAQKPNLRGGRLSKRTIAGELSTLRICLERLARVGRRGRPGADVDVPR